MRHLAMIASVLLLAGCGGGGGGSSSTSSGTTSSTSGGGSVNLGPAFGSFAHLPGVQNTPPPWNAGNGPALRPRLLAMGLKPLSAEGAVVHIHQHLDLYVAGNKVAVPPLVGIAASQQFISDLHIHDNTGIIHVESPTQTSFSLGQFFGVWGVPLSGTQIGSLKTGGGKVLKTWVNGKPVSADPTRIVLEPHAEIVIAYGTQAQMPKNPPSSYTFPAGL